ncbi:SDR family oxidoreductase [Sphingomonas sanguinis]|uniref:Short-chain dehydrogenase n=1 Tax=Sphingomonas sanguinis TaxID=33051 RepID=A0A147IN15_9SPHN|nr:SDR family oxidoreductase [Sphingomonas sanguinis]KTT96476.1 hypothetical protein SB4_15455 [Sphingomonas sanguinis]
MSEHAEPGWTLVTGASRGIGLATAQRLFAAGHRVVIWSRSTPVRQDWLTDAERDGVLIHQQVDVSNESNVDSALLDLRRRGFGLNNLILNAGSGRWTALHAVSTAEWRETLGVNLDGAFFLLKRLLPTLCQADAPLVVAVLSDSVLYPFAERAAYSAAKAGLRALLETTRLEFRPHGVRFSLLYPSRVDTHFAGSHATGRPGLRPGSLKADDIAETIAFIMALPPRVEIREVHMASRSSSFGPFGEKLDEHSDRKA